MGIGCSPQNNGFKKFGFITLTVVARLPVQVNALKREHKADGHASNLQAGSHLH